MGIPLLQGWPCRGLGQPLRRAQDYVSSDTNPLVGAGLSADDALGGGDRAKGERAMSQASAGGGGGAEFERTLVQRSMEDEEFRQRLLDDPKGTLEQEGGTPLSEGP